MLVLVLFLMACKSEAFLGIGDSHDFSTFKTYKSTRITRHISRPMIFINGCRYLS